MYKQNVSENPTQVLKSEIIQRIRGIQTSPLDAFNEKIAEEVRKRAIDNEILELINLGVSGKEIEKLPGIEHVDPLEQAKIIFKANRRGGLLYEADQVLIRLQKP